MLEIMILSDIVTTSGPDKNSPNIRYLSQGDKNCSIRKPNLCLQSVTISVICHWVLATISRVLVTISDTYCNMLLERESVYIFKHIIIQYYFLVRVHFKTLITQINNALFDAQLQSLYKRQIYSVSC